MYSRRPQKQSREKSREFEDLDHRQTSFLRWIGTLIPALLKSIARGNVSARWILGRRRLKDGRNVELSLVADAPEKGDGNSMYSTHGGASSADKSGERPETPVDNNKAQKQSANRK